MNAPAEVFPPLDFIREEVQERGWTDQEAMDHLRWGPLVWQNVMDGTYEIDAALAEDLEHGFGISRVFWLNLQAMYDQHKVRAVSSKQEDES